MKTILIVEDEKNIRQGLKAMILRSGVPVEVILECNNGETALEIIKEQEIDMMFTDIRMPKMDGVELVRQMQSCEHVPLTVAISGYDDFSYAVEMLRKGIREYILKPIERQKITEILQTLNLEIEEKREKEQTNQEIGVQQIRYLLLSETLSEAEYEAFEKQYAGFFYPGEYIIFCQNSKKESLSKESSSIYLGDMESCDFYIVPVEEMAFFTNEQLTDRYVGISSRHKGVRSLKIAYQESLEARKRAFLQNKMQVHFEEKDSNIPEGLMREAAKLSIPSATVQRVQLLGTAHTEELEKCWKQLFTEAKRGRIHAAQFEECITDFINEGMKTYKNVSGLGIAALAECREIWKESCINVYEEKLMDAIMELHDNINYQYDTNRNTQKMKLAMEYIQENYANNLNMAVVSNHISMNYSLFSYSFKQYSGSNFVNYLKDIRMLKAKQLLEETDRKIFQISQDVGYDNEKHFMKLFKQTCGVSPTEYRKNMEQIETGNG